MYSSFHPDYTVAIGVPHLVKIKTKVGHQFLSHQSGTRGVYHRLGIPRLAEVSTEAGHPTPKE